MLVGAYHAKIAIWSIPRINDSSRSHADHACCYVMKNHFGGQRQIKEGTKKGVRGMKIVRSEIAYTPTPGFYDLTTRPKNMPVRLHRKVQGVQMALVRECPKYDDPKVREANRASYERLQEYMAKLQMIILEYWGDSAA